MRDMQKVEILPQLWREDGLTRSKGDRAMKALVICGLVLLIGICMGFMTK